ncbi:MAG: OmpA family protein [Bacteroidia bacterium]
MAVLCLWVSSISAQQYERRWALGAGVNFMDYAAPQGAKMFETNNWDMGYYMSLQRYLSAAFRLSADITYAYGVRFPSYQGTNTRPALADMSYRLAFKFNNGTLLGERALIAPYASFGIGGSYVKSHPDLYIPLGGGLNIRAGDRTSFRLEMTYKRSLNQDYQHLAHTAYLVYDLGKQKKFAPEFVPEEEKETGPWMSMEAPDEDNDGVPDHYDRCPADPGSWAWQGCPGVPAGPPGTLAQQTEPIKPTGRPAQVNETKPAVVEATQPSVPTIKSPDPVEQQGNASFTDNMEKTSSTPVNEPISSEPIKVVEPVAIPDDRYSNSGSFLDPVVSEKPEEKNKPAPTPCEKAQTEALRTAPVYFELGSEVLSSETRAALDEVARMLQRCSNVRLEVLGHADALGSERNNQLLSVLRANAVKRYLVYQHGISLSRIRCQGFGEQSPSSDNNTLTGRTRNRRVDFRWE